MRRPLDHAIIGDGTAEHAARRVGPAQDYPCPVGTPVHAPFTASRVVRSGTVKDDGGLRLTGYADNGDYWVIQHLSAYTNRDHADEGAIVALSGNTGTKTTGPHVHHYVVLDGTRYNPEDIGLYASTASDNARPFTPTLEHDMSPFILVHPADGIGHLFLVGAGGNGVVHLDPDHLDVGTADYWKLSDGSTLKTIEREMGAIRAAQIASRPAWPSVVAAIAACAALIVTLAINL